MQIQGHEVGEDKDFGAKVTRKLLLRGGRKQGEHSDAQLLKPIQLLLQPDPAEGKPEGDKEH